MAEQKNGLRATQGADAEIELSVDDLVSLAEAPQGDSRTSASHGAAMPNASSVTPPLVGHTTPRASKALPRNAIVMGLLTTVIIAGAAMYTHAHSRAGKDVQPVWKPAFPAPPATAETSEPDEAQPQPEGPPVRYANPFDRTEVFEFPPGTTRAAARDAVADILLQRAIEREQAVRK